MSAVQDKPSEKKRKSTIQYPEVYVADVWAVVWNGVKKHWLSLAITIVGIIAASSVAIFVPLLYKKFFDVLSRAENKTLASPELVQVVISILLLNLCSWLSWRVGSLANISFQAKTMASLRQQAYSRLLYHSYTFFSNNFSGAIVQRIGRFARAFEKIADRITWNLIPLLVRLLGVVVVTLFIDRRLTLIIFVWTLVYMTSSYLYSLWRLKYNIRMAEADSRTTAVLADTIANQNTIDIFNRHKDEIENFKSVTEDQRKITELNWNINSGLDAVQAFLAIAVEFFVFLFAIYFWKYNAVSIGTFVLIQLYIIGLSGQLWDFARIIRDFYEAYADMKEMVEIMKLPYEIKNAPDAKPFAICEGNVAFEHVHFSFNKTREVLSDVSIEIKAGEKIALIGPSGAGKTTFVRLLMRLYDVTAGSISIDGQNIQHITLESLRENISLVPQDPILFHRTLKENISYGKTNASDEEIFEAARLAHCDEFIRNFPQGYDTYVGERGVKLSGGERQRVAIARAILKNAPILILDEATSSLDSHSEMLIQDALDALMKNKTTIVIAHRLSTIKKMDRIIVVEDGKIIEEGSHENLIANTNSLYKKLWTLQAGGFIQ